MHTTCTCIMVNLIEFIGTIFRFNFRLFSFKLIKISCFHPLPLKTANF